MNYSPVLVLVLAVLVPTFCINIEDRRCELRDQLKASLSSRNQRDNKMARVICEVEKFVKASSVNPTNPNRTKKSEAGAYLKNCVAVTDATKVTVDAVCFGMNWVFEKVYLYAGEKCEKISPKDFFQKCSNVKT